MCRRARNPPPLGSVILWCMMYAQKGNLMFIHDFQGNASAKPSDFPLRNKTTWDWDFSLKAHRPSCSTSSVSFPLSLPLSHTHTYSLSYLTHSSFSSLLNSPSIFFLSDLIYLTLRKKITCSYFLLILPGCLPILPLYLTKDFDEEMNLDRFHSRLAR